MIESAVTLDGREYTLRIRRTVSLDPQAPRLVVVAHQENRAAQELLKVCLASVRRFTPEPHELWVVDNNSPEEHVQWLRHEPDTNLIFNRTEPLPPDERITESNWQDTPTQRIWGSYANAVGLEIGVRLIDPASRYLMTMHMDTLPCRSGWLSFLASKLTNGVAAAGVRMDRTRVREGVLHVLGYMVDFQLFKTLGLDFFPQLPDLDVGDRVSVRLREAGYDLFECRNSLWEPDLVEKMAPGSPLRNLQVDRAFDDKGNPVFLHLGRGLLKASGEHARGVPVEKWIEFARVHLLGECEERAGGW
jgi:hypothetical protein